MSHVVVADDGCMPSSGDCCLPVPPVLVGHHARHQIQATSPTHDLGTYVMKLSTWWR
ncbi:hypothetical protein [[Kitasatospora] papulosa]|uniref:hypothetical protein n=1 Tax=Streptomyces TaxID=1883 RepID=UPI0036915C99